MDFYLDSSEDHLFSQAEGNLSITNQPPSEENATLNENPLQGDIITEDSPQESVNNSNNDDHNESLQPDREVPSTSRSVDEGDIPEYSLCFSLSSLVLMIVRILGKATWTDPGNLTKIRALVRAMKHFSTSIFQRHDVRTPAVSRLVGEGLNQLVHTIYRGRYEDMYGGIKQVVSRLGTFLFLLASYHICGQFSHLHILHACRWNSKQRRCTCAGFAGLASFRIPGLRRKHLADVGDSGLAAILLYFRKGARKLVAISCGEFGYWDLPHSITGSSHQPRRTSETPLVASPGLPLQTHHITMSCMRYLASWI